MIDKTKKQSWGSFSKEGGIYWLAFVALVSFFILLTRPIGAHYTIFSGAAQAFWSGAPMYGAEFAPGIRGYFYSPTCAAFFYSLFAFLPPQLGRGLYMGLSLLFLFFAIDYLRRTYRKEFGREVDAGLPGQCMWVMLSSEINGAILAEKLEVLILGIFFFCLAQCWQRRYTLPLILLTLVANWKFQSLPILGLALLVLWGERHWFRQVLVVVGSTAVFFALPFLFQPAQYLWAEIGLWQMTLTQFMQNAWMAPIFHHVYGWVAKNFDVEIAYATAQRISAICGASFAVLLAHQTFVRRENRDLIWATVFGLGAGFGVLFSPLSQGTGYLLYLPLVLLTVIQCIRYERSRGMLLGVLLVAYFFASLCVSDLTPQPWRGWFYSHAFKAVGGILLLFYFVVGEGQRIRARILKRAPLSKA